MGELGCQAPAAIVDFNVIDSAYLAFGMLLLCPLFMTDKQAVIDVLARLPEAASLEEIIEELHIMAAIRRARSDISAGRSKSHQDVEQLVESWATSWNSN